MSVLSSQWEKPKVIKDTVGQEFCYIPRRPFQFGKTKKLVQLTGPFYMGKHPITCKQFKQFVEKTNYSYKLFDIMEQISPEPGCPATPLSWYDAKAYVNWLRTATGEYYSLPIESEWELAARGSDGRLYPWGNTPPTEKHGTFSFTFLRRQTNMCGRFPMNISPYGCVDMVGNVWEWCQNEADQTIDSPVLRGGACIENEPQCSCVSRIIESNLNSRILYAGVRLIYLTKDLHKRYCAISDQQKADRNKENVSFTTTLR